MRYKPMFFSLLLLLTMTSFASLHASLSTNLGTAQSETEIVLTIHTDKFFYVRGELVKINGTTEEVNGIPIERVAVGVEVKDSTNNTIFLDGTYSLPNGTYKSNFRLPTDAPYGQYNVYATAHKTGYSTATNKTSFYVEEVAHDIAVASVIPSKTVVGQNYSLFINVTVENQGEYTETFNVTCYADLNTSIIGDEITIGIQNVTLASGNSTTITFTWDTTGVAKSNYTISAYATPVPGETDTAYNTLVDGWVVVTIAGDVDGDYDVDYRDLFILAKAYGCTIEDACYVPNADLDCNGKIDYKDLFILAKNYGKSDP